MITHRMIPARDLEPGLATIVVALPGKTIRSRVAMVQLRDDVMQVAFASGDILTLSARAMVGRIDAHRAAARPAAKRRATP
jgi:hypothetical protein